MTTNTNVAANDASARTTSWARGSARRRSREKDASQLPRQISARAAGTAMSSRLLLRIINQSSLAKTPSFLGLCR